MPLRPKSSVALDIGSHAIKVVEIVNKAGEVHLLNYGVETLPPDSIVDSEVMDRQLVTETIQNLFEKRGIKNRRVVSAVAGRGVIVKRIRMEKAEGEEAAEAIRIEAENHVPYDMEEVSLDFQILNPDVSPRDMEVLLVAAKRERISDHAQLLREAGLTPIAIDLHAFAIQNALEWNHDINPEEVLALINIGAEMTNIHIIRDNNPLYTQDASTGGHDFIRGVQKAFQCTREEAMDALRGGKDSSGMKLDTLVEEFCAELSNTLEKSLLYLQTSTEDVERIHRVFLSGGGALIRGLSETLNRMQDASVEIVDPFKRIRCASEIFAGSDPKGFAPQLTVGVGLALRRGQGQ
ncbi:MAG: pilus assembly protein PilM [Candidatus Eisenbacteria bacterium]|uniref:Pilus assembly protein PilM n=1 Tax=Eiseniibacteriota bacterium TaxID=2212470 RepID=A0A948RVV5_UNCEI|nr:pilus assembly protein PilM [Candidatus Eisenbacteria bacterium]MBU1948015.1 pilus assembly protein PilM [Candidatus Eisenbacteria bacterium]MBU2691446.1 pilus assembly protein PilM [Candidatus Eisenbacteria bacterium]